MNVLSYRSDYFKPDFYTSALEKVVRFLKLNSSGKEALYLIPSTTVQ